MATDTVIQCNPQGMIPTASNAPTIDYRGGSPEIPCLDFDDTTNETAYWLCRMPTDYGSGGLTVEILWTFAGTSTNNFGAEVGFARLQDATTDTDVDNFAANNTGTWAHNGTSGVVNKDTITFTDGADMDSIAAGDFFLVRLVRNASVGTDLVGDVEVLGMAIRET